MAEIPGAAGGGGELLEVADPDRPVGVPFADADVTDESLAERAAREVPELEVDRNLPLRLVEPDVLVDSELLEQIDEDGDLAEPD